jgi:putative transposase
MEGRKMPKSTPYKHLAHVSSWKAEPLVFMTVTTAERKRLLDNSTAHDTLRGIWERSARMNGWFVGDYVLMPDHVHIFVRNAREADPMTRWVQMWKSVSGRVFIKTFGTAAPVWQEEYFDRFLRTDESYAEKWAYVEMNPVRAGLVSCTRGWPYRGRIHDLTGC